MAIRFILLLTMLLSFECSEAQTARQILDKTSAIVGRKGGASASFSLNSGKYGKTTGHIAIKGNRFYASTASTKVWFDGKTQWTYMASTNEVNVSYPNEAQQMSMNPYKFITMYKNGYNMNATKKNGNYVVHLTAQNQRRSVSEMYITIGNNYQPKVVKMRQGKTWTTINISNFRAKNIPNSTFYFHSKEYPSAEVIDLR
jgi:outer membrane lipoprotein-sorting protein